MRRPNLLTALALAAGLAGLSSNAGAATQPFANKTAAQILGLASAAMAKAGSVHVVNNSVLGGSASFTQTTDSSRTVGTQTQKFGSGVAAIRLIGSSLYLNANTDAYSQDFNVANSTLAGRWVRVPASNPNYANVSSAILLPSLIENVFQMTSLKDLGVRAFHGVTTVAIEGSPPNTTPGTSLVQTVYVAVSAPHLPVGLTTTFLEGVNGTGTILFSRWGERLKVLAPSPVVVATSKDFP